MAASSGQRSMLHLTKRQDAVLYVSLFLVLVGSRAAVINYGGNSVPFGDEWDAVAAGLLRPYLQGHLKLAELFSAHNEHVIFFTRLMTLLIFKISGYWDVILQMIANAILDALTVVAISAALSRTLPGGWAQIAVILSVLINAIPLGLGKHSAWVQHPLLSAAGVLVCGSLASGGQPGVVAPMVRGRPLLGRFISLHGVGRLDPRRGDRSPSCADRVQSQGRAQRMAWNCRARRGHARFGARGSARDRVWRVGGALAW